MCGAFLQSITILKRLTRYILATTPTALPDDDAAEGSTRRDGADAIDNDEGKELTGSKRKKWSKEDRKNKRGANKGRRFQKVRDELELCWKIASGKTCEFGSE